MNFSCTIMFLGGFNWNLTSEIYKQFISIDSPHLQSQIQGWLHWIQIAKTIGNEKLNSLMNQLNVLQWRTVGASTKCSMTPWWSTRTTWICISHPTSQRHRPLLTTTQSAVRTTQRLPIAAVNMIPTITTTVMRHRRSTVVAVALTQHLNSSNNPTTRFSCNHHHVIRSLVRWFDWTDSSSFNAIIWLIKTCSSISKSST